MTTATQANTHDAHTEHAEHPPHPPHLAHHFDTPEQQMASGKLGMWAFLATELLMFGGLFCAYSVYRHNHPDVFLFSHLYLDKIWGGINTAILIASSFTMAWAVRASQLGQRNLMRVLLALTFMGGVGFMIIKGIEYKSKWEHHLFPGHFNAFNPVTAKSKEGPEMKKEALAYWEHHANEGHTAAPETGVKTGENEVKTEGAMKEHGSGAGHDSAPGTDPAPAGAAVHVAKDGPGYLDPHKGTGDEAKIFPSFVQPVGLAAAHGAGAHHVEYTELNALSQARVNTFFGVYFIMTGLHGIHVLVGMGIIAWLFVTAGRYSPDYYTPVDIGGLYWHLVDLIWIFLFPLLYLIH